MMKRIILKKLKLVNFKGIKEKTIDFTGCTNIYGDNATGKTTIFDAFTWVMFGKDSGDKKDFNIKTLDENGNAIPKIEHEVEAVLIVNDIEVVLKSILREKWVTKRGASEPEFTGHETTYFFNDVPMKQEEYKKKIREIIDEKLFRIITNPIYFNSLKWPEMRKVLFELVPFKTDKEIAASCTDVEYLAEIFDTKTVDEYKKETSAKRKKINSELEALPVRIDEVTRGMPESENWEELEQKVSEETGIFDNVVKQINELNMPSENDLKIKEEIGRIKSEMFEFKLNVENEFMNKKNSLSAEITELKNESEELEINLKSRGRKISSVLKEIEDSNTFIENLRNNIKKLNDKVFDESTTICPTCGRIFESDKVEEMKKHFEENKRTDFENFNERGKNLKKGVVELEAILEKNKSAEKELNQKLAETQEKLKQKNNEWISLKKPVVEEIQEYIEMGKKVSILEAQKDKPVDTSELLKEKNIVKTVIDDLNSRLSKRDIIDRGKQRIKELEENQRKLAQEKADLDKREFDIEKFIKFKIENYEREINSMFQFVKFKLFETQINGGETECCKAAVDGVPFNDLNNAMKINAGIDIINTLCGKYEVNAPIFIDNRESINKLVDCKSQIINLIVSKDKKLRVEED